ncbi:hypothetical protein [Amphibacillus cookii]|uniref:hypothetical protein n=1 Tax=Amphibacillus cookii TaxID=767787 RepID=UPI00195E332F|nr:hypothetical protein [Amphibacillus cookii]MBM7539945.1 hypothetical protein [Amphibacillus cookii]
MMLKQQTSLSLSPYTQGYENAITSGLFGMKMQGAATLFVVNMKRMIKLINEKEIK